MTTIHNTSVKLRAKLSETLWLKTSMDAGIKLWIPAFAGM